METINTLTIKLEEEAILYDYVDLNDKANGMCVKDGEEYYILLDSHIANDDPLHKTVLAEELGHYYTMIDDPTPKPGDSYHRKCRIDKEEEKALRWATSHVIPTNELLDFLAKNKRSTAQDLIDHFEVPKEFLMKKLQHMASKQEYYEVCTNYYLCLSNLPSIYITRFFDTNIESKAKALYGRK
ncbi:ImmA/IrrE family metallo-endopeptidase [Acidaminobacter sp. JC074]|uniref:ImmA/IrrE family metallo-endopeptidase n=1 Tax=Acidaminobacter sp. JC074 TaxID=2530199 RepID=UPI001F10D8F4|nr:ImmA/IrrE family metallo-endopeptidase [Acidaminobacter sp. JC074]MCH4891217.1 ImmA/IrrE family metallo-endopeptidase [Acidaminobacter sp. JC074]